jgi:NAD(P)-dependent dehydrogenase (short-subunit alcohol dehydrogenase family)
MKSADGDRTGAKRLGAAIVTGASRGIGRGIVLELAAHGFDVVGVATSLDQASGLHEVQARMKERGRKFVPVAADIADLSTHHRILDAALDAFSSVEVLVNNAGVAPLQRMDILSTTAESFDRVMDINLRGPFFLTQLVAVQMAQQDRKAGGIAPKIIFITSISADTASTNRAEYCVSKAGLSMAAQTYAVRLAEYGIGVFEIRPGIVQTDMTAPVKEKYDRLIEQGMLLEKRWGTPKDIGKAVAALATGYFDYATGAVIEVGGGFGVKRL